MAAKGFTNLPKHQPQVNDPTTPYRADIFFDAAYRHSRAEVLTDRDTIGPFASLLDARFHFNAVGNSIIRALTRQEPLPQRGALIRAWEHSRRGRKVLDIGSGSGHWIDFFLSNGIASEATGCEIAPRSIDHLRSRFADNQSVSILDHDIVQGPPESAAFDYVCAIGVMFHIVEDDRWQAALENLAAAAKPGAILFIGGEFGATTRNAQFHADDHRPTRDAAPDDGVYRVSKRLRSMSHWQKAASLAGLEVVDLVRTDSDPALICPENDLLVLRRPD